MKSFLKHTNLILVFGFILLTIGCKRIDPLEGEQYFKQLYIVGASSLVTKFPIPYQDEPSSAFVTVGSGGSLKIDKDVSVTLDHDDAAIDRYNRKYMIDAPVKYQMLGRQSFNIPSMTTTVKSGDIYSRLPFQVVSQGLHCDSLYAITFKIKSVSDYVKTPKDTVLVLNFDLINAYSGVYQLEITKTNMVLTDGNWVKGPAVSSLSASRTLKAADENTVRFFNEARAETRSGYASKEDYFASIKNWCVNFKKTSETSFAIQPWDAIQIVDAGSCVYKDGVFTFSYQYMDGTTRYIIEGKLSK